MISVTFPIRERGTWRYCSGNAATTMLTEAVQAPALDQHNNMIYNAVLSALTTGASPPLTAEANLFAAEPNKHRARNDALIGDFGAGTWCVQWVDGPEIPVPLPPVGQRISLSAGSHRK